MTVAVLLMLVDVANDELNADADDDDDIDID